MSRVRLNSVIFAAAGHLKLGLSLEFSDVGEDNVTGSGLCKFFLKTKM